MKAKRHRKEKSGDSFNLGETEVATVAAAVAAATATAGNTTGEDEEQRTNATANIDWEALAADANGGAGAGDEEEEEMGAQALLQLGNATKDKKKKKRKDKKTKKSRKGDEGTEEATAEHDEDEIAPELRDVDKNVEPLGSLEQEYNANDASMEFAVKDESKKKRKRDRSNTFTTSVVPTDVAAVAAAATANPSSTFESELQDFFHSGNPSWPRFYSETMTDDPATQVDINMLIEQTQYNNQPNTKGSKKQKRGSSNVDPALEQLDEPTSLEMTTKEQSQLEDAMMHASAIVRTLASGGSHHQFDNDSILLNQNERDGKKKRKNDQAYDEDLLNEAIKLAHTDADLGFDNDQQHSDSFPAPAKYRRKNAPQGDLAAISLAKDPALMNPIRNPGHPSASPATAARESARNKAARPATAEDSMGNNWRYVSLPGEADDMDPSKRISWTGDGSEHGGSFSRNEIDLINNFMMDYCQHNNMTRDQLCQRVWSNERRKDNFWDDVANILPNRTRASVYKHIRRAYHVFSARGKWTPSEDKELGMLVEEKGKQWKQIGLLMGRMPEDCRDRWRNYVKCGEKRIQNKWGVDEEERLRGVVTQLMASFPGQDINWTEVSDLMGGTRSRIQCRYKWTKLAKRAAMAKIDAMMPGDKISMLQFLKESGYEEESQVDWDGFAALDPRGFWSGEELHAAFQRLKSTLLDGANKPFRQVVAELLNDLLLLPEHRRQEKFRGGEMPSSAPVTNDVLSKPPTKSIHHGPQSSKVSQGGDLELTDDIIAVAAAAHAAMQESHASNGSGLDNSRSVGAKDKSKKKKGGAAADSPVDDGKSSSGAAAQKKNNDFYGIPPTASVFQQHRQQQEQRQASAGTPAGQKRTQQRNWGASSWGA